MLEFHYHELERKVFEESRRFAREVLRPYAAEATFPQRCSKSRRSSIS
jgi:hypothetical protein